MARRRRPATASSRASRRPSLRPRLRWRSGRAPGREGERADLVVGRDDERLGDARRGHGGADRRRRRGAGRGRAAPRRRGPRPSRDLAPSSAPTGTIATIRAGSGHATARREPEDLAGEPGPCRVVGHDRVGDEGLDAEASAIAGSDARVDVVDDEVADERRVPRAPRRARSTPRRATRASGRPGP